jgi:DNA-binding NarL/FixJ family response regulator
MTDTINSPVHIMLVDDHPLVRDGLRARLEAVPHFRVVLEAGSGAEALAMLEATRVDLVLMDITMRDGSGIDATAQLGRSHPGIAVLILSMHDKLEYVTQAMQAGARGYVLKDAPGKDIVLAIDTVMAGGIYYSAPVARQLARPSTAGQPADHARTGSAAPSGQRRIEQADRPRARFVGAHRRNPPFEHQAQAGHRRAGGTDQIRGPARQLMQ